LLFLAAYSQIDWHDFVVVETVDYQPQEQGNFPVSNFQR
jgi:splicing factor 3A subunit 1